MKKRKIRARMEYLQTLVAELNEECDDSRREIDRLESEIISLKVDGFDAMVHPLRIGFAPLEVK
jgi:hypothetical protein